MVETLARLVIIFGGASAIAAIYFWRLHSEDHRIKPLRKGHGLALVIAILGTLAALAGVYFAYLAYLSLDNPNFLIEYASLFRPVSFFMFILLDILWVVLAIYLNLAKYRHD